MTPSTPRQSPGRTTLALQTIVICSSRDRTRLVCIDGLPDDQAVHSVISDISSTATVVRVGNGGQTLGGVQDESVFPTRTQIVMVRTP
jgi:hypothetical protein